MASLTFFCGNKMQQKQNRDFFSWRKTHPSAIYLFVILQGFIKLILVKGLSRFTFSKMCLCLLIFINCFIINIVFLYNILTLYNAVVDWMFWINVGLYVYKSKYSLCQFLFSSMLFQYLIKIPLTLSLSWCALQFICYKNIQKCCLELW